MASQPAPGPLAVAEIDSFIRGFHDYKYIWQPVVGEMLLLRKEPTNIKNRLAVCVLEGRTSCGPCATESGSIAVLFLG